MRYEGGTQHFLQTALEISMTLTQTRDTPQQFVRRIKKRDSIVTGLCGEIREPD